MPDIRILTEAQLRDVVALDRETVDVIENGFRALAGGGLLRGLYVAFNVANIASPRGGG